MVNEKLKQFDNESLDLKCETNDSNYDKNDGSNHGKTKWFVLLIVGFITFIYGIFSNNIDLPIKIPLGLIPIAWLCIAFSIFKIIRINKKLGITDSIFTPTYDTPEQLEKLQNSNRAFSSLGDCLIDLFKRHIFWAIPIVVFYGFALFAMIFFLHFETENEELPSSFKGLVKFLFKSNPIWGILITLVVLASPIILFFMESSMLSSVIKDGEGFSTCVLFALIALFPTAIVTNFLSGFVSFISLFMGGFLKLIRR